MKLLVVKVYMKSALSTVSHEIVGCKARWA
nr:MAG TPA: hypothetical protein [Caudoviricetes sp.]